MLKRTIFSIIIILLVNSLYAQYSPQWHQTYGGVGDQESNCLIEVSDGNFLLAGYSSTSNYLKPDYHSFSSSKALVIKFDTDGKGIWEKEFGKGKNQFFNSVIESENGDFILVGSTNYLTNGNKDLWLVRINAEGELIWDYKFGENGIDDGLSISKTSDNGFIVAGNTDSKGNGDSDVWILRFDAWGILLWDKTYGSNNSESASSILEAANGDLIFTGYTQSTENRRKDIILYRTDANGNKLWSKIFGNELNDEGYQVIESKNGDIILAGNTSLDEGKRIESLVLRTDNKGELLWEKYFGKEDRNAAVSLIELNNSDIAVAGFTASLPRGYDIQITILNEWGEHVWSKNYGGIRWDEAKCLIRTHKNNLVLAGYTKSYQSDEKDVWAILLQPDITPDDEESTEILPDYQILSDVDDNIPVTRMNGKNTLAVVIGIEKYKYATDAKFAEHDATIFFKYAKSVLGIPDRNIYFLDNENATQAEINKAFMPDGWLSRRMDENTDIIIYYAGHATPDRNPQIEEAYLIAHDTDPYYAEYLGIGINQLIENIGNMKPRSATLFFDACFSAVSKDIAGRDFLAKMIKYSNFSVFFSSETQETSVPFPQQNHGLFTYYLLKGLKGEALGVNERKLSVQSLYNYIRANVSYEAGFLNSRQNPKLLAVDKNKTLVEY